MPATTSDRRHELQETLRKYWGYDSFLPLQAEAMQGVMARRDSVVVLPTGGGKSLCFQAPAMCLDGLAVVVSPLISLMKDQVDALRSSGVPAACVNSMQAMDERRAVADQIRAGRLRLLYMAPERLLADRTIEFLQETAVSFFAIDEAHCISSWGHDFRPEYRGLRVLKERFPGVALHAFTATATSQVREDISNQLGLADPQVLVGSFDRPNLVYTLHRRSGGLQQIREVIDRHPDDSGIVYCITRADVDRTAGALNQLGYQALPYHAGLDDRQRHDNQDAFIHERVNTIVATVAFGMGIDKSNVRYVIHAGMPKSLEAYQQESGRAGRDGLEAECCLLYSGGDFMTWKRIIEDSETAGREGAMEALNAIYNFCTGVECRHQALVTHFGQSWQKDSCDACDVCLGTLDTVDDALIVGQKILSCVLRVEQRFGADYVSQVVSGSNDKRIVSHGHDRLSTWGILAEEGQRASRDWIEQLISQHFLAKEGEYNVLKVTAEGRRLLRGEVTPRLLRPAKRAKKERSSPFVDSWEGVDRELFERLRELRSEHAARQQVPAYIVFSDAVLREMARLRPSTPSGFRQVRGVGEKKNEDFGEEFLGCITSYCQQHGVSMDQAAADHEPEPLRSEKSGPSVSATLAFPYFDQGKNIAEVAQALKRATSTTAGYLTEYLRHKRITDPSPWVDAATVERVLNAANETGVERLKPIHDALGGEVDYERIRIVVECLRNRAVASEG